tara:strand:+ start:141 stop:554 length:414 start_codon:yes stop_codon:yes gene_type:complete
MFGNCIWAELNKTNKFYNINKILFENCKTQLHIPHITLEYNSKEKNLNNFKKMEFKKTGNVYSDVTKNFYSLQQDYLDNDNKLYHVSLAYKVNIPFTENEVKYANTLEIPSKIKKEDYNITLWNCNSVYTSKWFKIF